MKTIKYFFCTCLLAISANAMSQGITGTVKCKMLAMVNTTTGKETAIKGDETWGIVFNGSTGAVLTPAGKRLAMQYSSNKPGPKATGYVYRFTDNEIFEKMQINIDNGSSIKGKTVVLLDMKRVADMDISTIGFCNP